MIWWNGSQVHLIIWKTTRALPGKQHQCTILCLEYSIKIITQSLMIIYQDYKNKALTYFSMVMSISTPMPVFIKMKSFKIFNTLMEVAANQKQNGSFLQEMVNPFQLSKVKKFISSLWDILEDTPTTSASQILNHPRETSTGLKTNINHLASSLWLQRSSKFSIKVLTWMKTVWTAELKLKTFSKLFCKEIKAIRQEFKKEISNNHWKTMMQYQKEYLINSMKPCKNKYKI